MSNAAQELLFDELEANANAGGPKTIFILAAPRTGSTTLYKAMISSFGLPFIANITNDHFAKTPIVGMSVQKSMPTRISSTSSYGKTRGTFQPSEGSAVLGHWFGGGHPSQIKSNSIKSGMQEHFIVSLNAIEKLYGAPLVIKNPWNCFRVEYLARALPNARFVWLQRDIVEAAGSDLYARYVTKGDANEWNSATPANYQKLQKLLPVEQVVENQFEFNNSILRSLEKYAHGQWTNVWFEDFLVNRENVLKSLASDFDIKLPNNYSKPSLGTREKKELSTQEQREISNYVHSVRHYARLNGMIYCKKK